MLFIVWRYEDDDGNGHWDAKRYHVDTNDDIGAQDNWLVSAPDKQTAIRNARSRRNDAKKKVSKSS